ncbi:nucleoside phosphorylase domain-containing protein [Talaromyces proteolyticus]|uniref:Nucleoside phosphorylase domain-containing protein n=1 Tax=Talaromyces proteolyticus TaxID=1131652 RepID=A0AAD4KEM8_9EURO|nr:nucleoside phosphorylase domain-containing protein [Talaromyces proteolyticus]KAH8690153.1 nucleoside phosphorylase domain-containing protein [Talaromyces proteolyticus]
MSPPTCGDYTIAWICALPVEVAAAKAILDEIHQSLLQPSTDPNAYIYGTISASTSISHLASTFRAIQFVLMVGIGGGVPSRTDDIQLGDVVISKSTGKYSGVIQYDHGKTVQGGCFEQTGMLNHPPQSLLTRIAHLQADQMAKKDNGILTIIQDVIKRNPDMNESFIPPGQDTDSLFRSSYQHIDNDKENKCVKCDKQQLVHRHPRNSRTPHIHYGLIASGDQMMEDSETRDRLTQQLGILYFKMEAVGLMNQLPTLVIRGISNYCNSHKHKDWQRYVALTVAVYTKLLLSLVPVRDTNLGLPSSNKVEIEKLKQLITMQDRPRRVAITGLEEVRKTQMDQYKESSIFWIPCTSHAMIEQAYLNITQTLALHDIKPAESEQGYILFTTQNRKLAMNLIPFDIVLIPDVD